MAVKFPLEQLGVLDDAVPKKLADGAAVGGAVHRFRATIELAATGNGSIDAADVVELCRIPAGAVLAFGMLRTTVSLAAAQVAIGTGKTHATNGQYRAAAAFTAVETPTLFGLVAAAKAAGAAKEVPVYLSASAALPTAGTLVVDLFLSTAR